MQMFTSVVPLRAATLTGPEPGAGYTIAVALMAPFSRGTVRLADAAPDAAPLIDPRYYADAATSTPWSPGCVPPARSAPHPPSPRGAAEEARRAATCRATTNCASYVRRSLRSYSHYVGTCRIGTDDEAVVDTDLRVRGVEGLRVADASVMPSPCPPTPTPPSTPSPNGQPS